MFHPAALQLAWAVGVVALQWLSGMSLSIALLMVAIVAGWRVPLRSLQLLRRTRWLLISLFVIFLFGTPGEYLPGWLGAAGITREGVVLGVEHLGRMLVLLLSLAALHQHLGNHGMLNGLYFLLQPFPVRAVTVVRLMLVLELVEQQPRGDGWKIWLQPRSETVEMAESASESATVLLVSQPLHRQDVGLVVLVILVAICLGVS